MNNSYEYTRKIFCSFQSPYWNWLEDRRAYNIRIIHIIETKIFTHFAGFEENFSSPVHDRCIEEKWIIYITKILLKYYVKFKINIYSRLHDQQAKEKWMSQTPTKRFKHFAQSQEKIRVEHRIIESRTSA
jgi:hypothetical protein